MDKAKIAKYCSHANNENIRKYILNIIKNLFSTQKDIVFIKMELRDLMSELRSLQRTHRKRFKYLDSKIKEAPTPKDRLQPRKQKRAAKEIGARKNEIDNLDYALKYLGLQLKDENFTFHLEKLNLPQQEKINAPIKKIEKLPLTIQVPKFDPNKKVYSRVETCEFLNISNRKLTTLISELRIKPVSTAVKPYTFNIEELERYRKEEM